MLHYPRLIFQISKATVKRFRYVLFKTNKIITKLKISYCNIFMFTFAKPEQLSVIKVNCIKILLKYMLKYVTTNANYCKTIPKKNNFYSALCSQISETFFHCSWFMMHVWEAISKTRASCFIGVSKHSKTIKALGLRPRAFISFLVFGNPDETLALVFEILRQSLLYRCIETSAIFMNLTFHLST